MSDFKELLDDYDVKAMAERKYGALLLAGGATEAHPTIQEAHAARAALVKCYDELNTRLLRERFRHDDALARLHTALDALTENAELDQDDKTKTSGVTRGT